DLFHERTGKDGLGIKNMNWLLHHFRGDLYCVGRLEFEMKKFGSHVQVLQKKDGEIITLSLPNIRYRMDGHVNGTNQIYDDMDCPIYMPIHSVLNIWQG